MFTFKVISLTPMRSALRTAATALEDSAQGLLGKLLIDIRQSGKATYISSITGVGSWGKYSLLVLVTDPGESLPIVLRNKDTASQKKGHMSLIRLLDKLFVT